MALTKLTLSVEQSAIEKAKAIARAKGTSLSKIVESLFQSLEPIKSKQSEAYFRLRGAIKINPNSINDRQLVSDYLSDKYL